MNQVTSYRLSPTNIAGCNGIHRRDDDQTTGIIRFDLEGGSFPDGIVLEFPNCAMLDLAIKRLQELRGQWPDPDAS